MSHINPIANQEFQNRKKRGCSTRSVTENNTRDDYLCVFASMWDGSGDSIFTISYPQVVDNLWITRKHAVEMKQIPSSFDHRKLYLDAHSLRGVFAVDHGDVETTVGALGTLLILYPLFRTSER